MAVNKRYVWYALTLLAMIAAVILTLRLVAHVSLHQRMPEHAEKYTLTVKKGDTLIAVLNRLHADQLVHSPERLRLWIRIANLPTVIQTGNYNLSPSMTYVDLLHNLAIGRQAVYSIRINNGRTFRDFYAAIQAHPQIAQTLVNMTTLAIMNQLNSEYLHPEGMFYADTYSFYAGATDMAILTHAYTRLRDVLHQEWQARHPNLPYENAYQALILASVVEKEAALDSERPLIAGVFINRINRGMRLQADPTVIYGMGDRYDGNIRRRDLRQPTPYNTYVIFGLPPTPIALVDRRAIRAVLQPEVTDHLFFVAKADGSGSHYFSETLEKHERAVERYQRRRR